ncbi:hypothetical protein N7453_007878 [Penicillium expansum]|nr:hypothetical protein N7453_007878 [Penicillium expansum]
MELSHNLGNEDTRTPASSIAVGARVWYGLYGRKMAVVKACGASAGVALAGAAVAGAGRHDEYRFGRRRGAPSTLHRIAWSSQMSPVLHPTQDPLNPDQPATYHVLRPILTRYPL